MCVKSLLIQVHGPHRLGTPHADYLPYHAPVMRQLQLAAWSADAASQLPHATPEEVLQHLQHRAAGGGLPEPSSMLETASQPQEALRAFMSGSDARLLELPSGLKAASTACMPAPPGQPLGCSPAAEAGARETGEAGGGDPGPTWAPELRRRVQGELLQHGPWLIRVLSSLLAQHAQDGSFLARLATSQPASSTVHSGSLHLTVLAMDWLLLRSARVCQCSFS